MAVAYFRNINRFCLTDVSALIFFDKLVWLFTNGYQLSFKSLVRKLWNHVSVCQRCKPKVSGLASITLRGLI